MAQTMTDFLRAVDAIVELRRDDILSVYSGKRGHCCCGCSGKHYANPARLRDANAKRGYDYTPDEVSATMITRVYNIIKNGCGDIDSGETFVHGNGWISRIVDERLYVAYVSK